MALHGDCVSQQRPQLFGEELNHDAGFQANYVSQLGDGNSLRSSPSRRRAPGGLDAARIATARRGLRGDRDDQLGDRRAQPLR